MELVPGSWAECEVGSGEGGRLGGGVPIGGLHNLDIGGPVGLLGHDVAAVVWVVGWASLGPVSGVHGEGAVEGDRGTSADECG
jgi:hypothetical protein